MGACIEGNPTGLTESATDAAITEAYYSAKAEASHMSGHGGYTGTIAEASGVKIRRDLKFASFNAAINASDDFAKKWGPAVAVLVQDKPEEQTHHFVFVGCYSS